MTKILAVILWLVPSIAFGQSVILQPSGAPSIAITPTATAAAAQSLAIKTTAGNLYSVAVTATATGGFLMTFNAAAVPGDGSVTPLDCVVVPASTTVSINFAPSPPQAFSTGIMAVMSSTGCFTKTGLTAAFIKALAQ